jgi:hypothetical protein
VITRTFSELMFHNTQCSRRNVILFSAICHLAGAVRREKLGKFASEHDGMVEGNSGLLDFETELHEGSMCSELGCGPHVSAADLQQGSLQAMSFLHLGWFIDGSSSGPVRKLEFFDVEKIFSSFATGEGTLDEDGVKKLLDAVADHCGLERRGLHFLDEAFEKLKGDVELASVKELLRNATTKIEEAQVRTLNIKQDVEGIFDFFKNQHNTLDEEGKHKLSKILLSALKEHMETMKSNFPELQKSANSQKIDFPELQEGSDVDLQSFKIWYNRFSYHLWTLALDFAAEMATMFLLDEDGKVRADALQDVEKAAPKHLLHDLRQIANLDKKLEKHEFKNLTRPIIRQLVLQTMILNSISQKALRKRIFTHLASIYSIDDHGRLSPKEGVNWRTEFAYCLGNALAGGIESGLEDYNEFDEAKLVNILVEHHSALFDAGSIRFGPLLLFACLFLLCIFQFG